MTRTFTTTLRCGACVAKIRPALDAEPGLLHWHVDLDSPSRLLTVEGEAVNPARIQAILSAAGFEAAETTTATANSPTCTPATATQESSPPARSTPATSAPGRSTPAATFTPGTFTPPAVQERPTSYYPLALLAAYLLGVTLLIELAAGTWDSMRAMNNFMAGFFLAFSFFKLLDLQNFADSFAQYDLLARRSRSYGLAYPFIELSLGIAYLWRFAPTLTNTVTLLVMLLGTVGIVESLLNRRRVRCACLGTVFNLPMSYVTLLEDLSMAAMAAAMLWLMHG